MEHICEERVAVESLHLALEDPNEISDLHLVFRVCKHQILCDEEAQEIVLVRTIYWNTGETSLEDLPNGGVTQAPSAGQHVYIFHWCHHLPSAFRLELEGSLGHLLCYLVC